MRDLPDPRAHHVVCGALVRDGRILLAHRSASKAWYPDVWDFPGGHVEPGETSRAGLVRELREELNVRVPTPSTGAVLTLQRAGLLLEIWRIDDWEGAIVNAAPEEHDALRWFSPTEAQSLNLADSRYLALIDSLTDSPGRSSRAAPVGIPATP